jgi:D-alanyl-D-alanine endopeptidase (penicillin-binding protein 7)
MRFPNWHHKILTLAAPGLLFPGLLFIGLQAHAVDSTTANVQAGGAATLHVDTHLDAPESAAAAQLHKLQLPIGKPDLKSNSALIIDESTSAVLYSKQAEVAQPIASITKLMTALVVLDAQQPLDEKIEITNADRDLERNSTSRLTPGAKLNRGDLLHLALMSSENRAAHALGRNYPGGLTAFVLAMNAKAKELGMTHAHFVDPTGLSSDNVASPHDLSKLVIAASHNSTIRRFSTDKKYAVAVGRRVLEFRNTNTLVANPTWDIVVQKTGYITEAGKCLVMNAVIEGRSVVIVLLDSIGKYTRVADARRVKKWMEAKPVRVASVR